MRCKIYFVTMIFPDSAFIGITPVSGHKSFTYTALDRDLNLIALADGEIDDVIAFIAGQNSATVAVNSPATVNRGLVREMTKKKMLTPYQIRHIELRLAEYELRERGITVTKTPASVELCPAWMQAGFELYRKLGKMGFQKHSKTDSTYKILETNPHACYCVMAGQVPAARLSLEGRLQRQIILYEHGLGIKDPMDFFEEITRYKLAKGIWPVELLYLPEQLDALVAAYTVWLAVEKKGKITSIGDHQEGQIVLPVAKLKDRY